jgi:hypothetical protein
LANKKNRYYTDIIKNLYQGKDSIIEMAKILSYDPKRLVASVFTTNSKQYRDDVPVLFPSMCVNNGIISPPGEGSTSLLFWGPDRQPFLLPIQLNIPTVSVQNGVQQIDASPGYANDLLSLENIQSGEHLFRSVGGSYLFLKNSGHVELGTSALHRLVLDESDGSLQATVERVNLGIGTNSFYIGPASMDSNTDTRTHFFFDLKEITDESVLLPEIDDTTLLDQTFNKNTDYITLTDIPSIMTVQMGHVFDSQGNLVTDPQDLSELFSQTIITKNDVTITKQTSKGGREYIKTENVNGSMEVSLTPTDAMITQKRVVDGIEKTTHIEITGDGKIMFGNENFSYDLLPMLQWFYEQRV